MTPFIDQEARDTARTRLDRNIVVEAGAGTGKTRLLIERMLYQLLESEDAGRADITRMVALTFTKKAAGEIKVRLQKALLESRSPRADAALRDLDRAPIGTIHSFAAQVLQLYPLEAGVDPGFQVDERQAFEELFAVEWALWLDSELGEQAPREAAWSEVLRHAGLEDLEALARGLCGAKVRSVGPTRSLSELLQREAAEVETLPKGQPEPSARSRIKDVLSEIARRLQETAAAARDGADPLPARRRAFTPPQSSWPKDWPEAGDAVYRRARRLAERTGPFEHRLVSKAAALLAPFVEAFHEQYARRSHVSFDGLLLKTRDLLRDHPRVREELKAAYGAILVDEFQDTDPLQGEILLYLCEQKGRSGRRWEDVRLEAGKLFVVGDPKQSIYRFRGADIAAYQRFVELMQAQGAELCRLQTNFRSTKQILDRVNNVFSKVMVEKEGSQPRYIPIQPALSTPTLPSTSEGREVEVWRVEGGTAGEGREAEAEAIARWVFENCGEGKRPFKDVAILLRSTTPLPAYLAPLKRLGIRYVVEGEKYFYGTQEVLDFLNLLRAIDEPADAVSLVGLLRSPLVGLTDAAILRLSEAGALSWERPRRIPADLPGARRLKAFYGRLAEYHSLVGRLPLGTLVRRILLETFLIELAALAYHREQTIGNLLKFARLAAAAGDERGLSLKEFAGELAESVETAQEEGESPLADEHLDAVRLLTIHKAKGLEYPVVFLPNLSAKRGGGGEKPAVRVDWSSGELGRRLVKAGAADAAMALLEAQEEERERDEEARLLYVAMTRARERLFLLLNPDSDANAPFAQLLETAGVLGEEGTLLPAPPPINGRREDGGSGEQVDAEALAAVWKRRQEAFERAMQVPAFVNPAAATPPPIHGRRPGGEPLPVGSGRYSGSLCHFVLERWDYRGKNDLEKLLAEAIRALGPGDADEARVILEGFLESPVSAQLAKAEIVGREVPVLYCQDGQVVRGAIDLLYKEGGKWVVADYKSEKVGKKELKEAAQRYAPQARYYAEAVRRILGEEPLVKVIFLRVGVAVEVLAY